MGNPNSMRISGMVSVATATRFIEQPLTAVYSVIGSLVLSNGTILYHKQKAAGIITTNE
jgi:hypothetical protein